VRVRIVFRNSVISVHAAQNHLATDDPVFRLNGKETRPKW